MFPPRFGILLDGEYVKKVLQNRLNRFPTVNDIMSEVQRMRGDPAVDDYALYRIFYYTAEPLAAKSTNPLDGSTKNFGETEVFARNEQLIDRLDNQPDVAVRRGALTIQGWKIGRAAKRALTSGEKENVEARDLVPNIQQKGVDMRIGLDLASLALKRLVSAILIVSGDSDLVPALKLARIEGLRVFLDTLGQKSVRPELKVHTDLIFPTTSGAGEAT